MRVVIAAPILLLAAGCAATGEGRLAQAECKVYPVTTASATGVRKPQVSALEQRHAEMQLATSELRHRQLRERGLHPNTVEDALRDCALR